MADWRQIRGRIRRAKAGPDAASRLEQLFAKTRDGMVAFELAELEELAGKIDRATDWYKQAWQCFRRSEWKQKAETALARHGIVVSKEMAGSAPPITRAAEPNEEAESPAARYPSKSEEPQPQEGFSSSAARDSQPESQPSTAKSDVTAASLLTEDRSPRRRRRGGRGRGRRGRQSEPAPAIPAPQPPALRSPEHDEASPPTPRVRDPERRPFPEREHIPERHSAREASPTIHVYRRVGEPALASEIKALEAKLRQLLAAHPDSVEHAGELPASPGVYVISDLDLTTFYYVEAYGNMRAAVDQLLSGRRGRQGSVRSRLGHYLGIGDNQTARYLKQHCVIRWLEMEESDAVSLGHFAIAVLRPKLNEEET